MRVCSIGVAVVTLILLSGVHTDPSNEAADVKPRRYRKVLVRRTPLGKAPGPATGLDPTDESPAPTALRLSRSAGGFQWEKIGDDFSDNVAAGSAPRPSKNIPGLPPGAKIISEQAIRLPEWAKNVHRLDIPINNGQGNSKLSPIILIPVPVKDSTCSANNNEQDNPNPQPSFPSRGASRRPRPNFNDDDAPAPPRTTRPKPQRPAYDDDYISPEPVQRPRQQKPRPKYDDNDDEPSPNFRLKIPLKTRPAQNDDDDDEPPVRTSRPKPRPAPADDDYDEPAPSRPQRPKAPRPSAYDDDFNEPAPPAPRPKPSNRASGAVLPPVLGDNVPSSVLLQYFRAQQPRAPHLPPVLIRERRFAPDDFQRPEPKPLGSEFGRTPSLLLTEPFQPEDQGYSYTGPKYIAPQGPEGEGRSDLSPPRFDRTLLVRGELTVPRADYTEVYTARWDPSGASHLELFDGATSAYRMVVGGDRITRAVVRSDRTGAKPKKRCILMSDSQLTPADRIPPIFPDTKDFSFKGYAQYGDIKAEMWKRTLRGSEGELGAAAGEALTYRHTLLLRRDNGSAVPLLYSVGIDSSTLGTDCDGYTHRYLEVREGPVDPQRFQFDYDTCDTSEETSDMTRVEPLQEYTLPQRHPRYDGMFKQYTKKFTRKYSDNTENAIRLNLFVQSSRFVAAGNRVGATFKMGMNFLADRLRAETVQLYGAVVSSDAVTGDAFPYSSERVRQLERKLPADFDWRERGAVSPVQFQGQHCMSCWAFAVAGAVEGALFRRTRRLVPLSPQALVDCAHPYGGHGCDGSWPNDAFRYVQERGLPALSQYPYHMAVEECKERRVPPVTHISSHVNVTQNSVPSLKIAIRRHSPTVVIINSACDSFTTYSGGVLYDDRCDKKSTKLNHAVLAVGWGEENSESHFILKNSWGAMWGEEGFVRVHGESNTCGLLAKPSYPRLELGDVDDASASRRASRHTSAEDTD